MPRAAHRLIDQSVGGIVADEELGIGIEGAGVRFSRRAQAPRFTSVELR